MENSAHLDDRVVLLRVELGAHEHVVAQRRVLDPRVLRRVADRAADLHSAALLPHQLPQQARQQRALAGAHVAHHNHQVARGDGQFHVPQDRGPPARPAKAAAAPAAATPTMTSFNTTTATTSVVTATTNSAHSTAVVGRGAAGDHNRWLARPRGRLLRQQLRLLLAQVPLDALDCDVRLDQLHQLLGEDRHGKPE